MNYSQLFQTLGPAEKKLSNRLNYERQKLKIRYTDAHETTYNEIISKRA